MCCNRHGGGPFRARVIAPGAGPISRIRVPRCRARHAEPLVNAAAAQGGRSGLALQPWDHRVGGVGDIATHPFSGEAEFDIPERGGKKG